MTGTLGGVTPVTKVDGRLIADGKAGKVTKEASDLYLRSRSARFKGRRRSLAYTRDDNLPWRSAVRSNKWCHPERSEGPLLCRQLPRGARISAR